MQNTASDAYRNLRFVKNGQFVLVSYYISLDFGPHYFQQSRKKYLMCTIIARGNYEQNTTDPWLRVTGKMPYAFCKLIFHKS
jgi:hypothetical protein